MPQPPARAIHGWKCELPGTFEIDMPFQPVDKMAPDACVICNAPLLTFGEISGAPVHCGRLFTSRNAALTAARSTIRLGFCRECGHIYNTLFDSSLPGYGSDYENSLDFSPLFRTYATALARSVVARHGLYGKNIVEIGCGSGEFLRELCALGNNRGMGFDPAAPANSEVHSIRFIRELFTDRMPPLEADFVCCRQTLEHIEHPRVFLAALRAALPTKSRAVVFLEVPSAIFTLTGIWDIIYEHCSTFSAGSLSTVLERAGFSVKVIGPAFEKQFLYAEALPSLSEEEASPVLPVTRQLRWLVDTFEARYRAKVAFWRDRIRALQQSGRRVALWGAGAKAITFLNAILPDAVIDYAVDINPRKTGRFIPCAGTEIVTPEFLVEYQPEAIVLMNAIYEPEVRASIAKFDFAPEILLASAPTDSFLAPQPATQLPHPHHGTRTSCRIG